MHEVTAFPRSFAWRQEDLHVVRCTAGHSVNSKDDSMSTSSGGSHGVPIMTVLNEEDILQTAQTIHECMIESGQDSSYHGMKLDW